jgi:RHS repeat-associated protein
MVGVRIFVSPDRRARFDAETGLHYNYFRDYDPAIGRYVEPDPIGTVPNHDVGRSYNRIWCTKMS